MNSRRSAAIAALVLLAPLVASAASQNPSDLARGHYVMDPRHSSLIGRVSHMGVSLYTFRFDTFEASFDYDPDHPESTKLEASVDPASLDNGADYGKKFAEEFLKASKFPKATFVTTAINPGTGGQGTMTGDLTLMGVTRPVTFNVTLIGVGHEPLPIPFGQTSAGFEATTTIKRSDFGSDLLLNLVGDDVTLQIEGEFDRK